MSPQIEYGDYFTRWADFAKVTNISSYEHPLVVDLTILESRFMLLLSEESTKAQALLDMESKLMQWRDGLRQVERVQTPVPGFGYILIRYEW